jgi:hypothetical protein
MMITLHQTERYHSDKASFSGRVSDYTTGWTFGPVATGNLVNAIGLVTDQDLDPGVSLAIIVPEGSRIVETAAGGLALFLPGRGFGLDASEAVELAREGRMGLAIAESE